MVAQNNVTNLAQAGVTVGNSQAPIDVQSSNQISIQNGGASRATSGSSIAKVAPAAEGGGQSLPLPATPVLLVAANGNGLHGPISNNVSGSANVILTPVPVGTPVPLVVNNTQQVSLSTAHMTNLTSANACGGSACAPVPAPAPAAPIGGANAVGGGSTTASTGAATANGLVAQNNVTTNGTVNVSIGGQNFGIINVIIESITNIVNLGGASATSGSSLASVAQPNGSRGGAAAASTGAATPITASSAAVQAANPAVQNQVQLNSSATVNVAGDNHSPINVFLDEVVNLFNYGSSSAVSGNAQATSPQLGSGAALAASSGLASATGLQVQNVANLASTITISISGSNYAPINAHIRFDVTVNNVGKAVARSGGAQALQPAGSTGGTAVGSPGGESLAPNGRGGSAVATTGSATTGGSTAVVARSGNSTSFGAVDQTTALNLQSAGVSGNSPNRAAVNETSLTVAVDGQSLARTGAAMVGITPSPTPKPNQPGLPTPDTGRNPKPVVGGNPSGSTSPPGGGAHDSNPSNASGGAGNGTSGAQQVTASVNGAGGKPNGWVTGLVVTANPWGRSLGFDLPSMPGQLLSAPGQARPVIVPRWPAQSAGASIPSVVPPVVQSLTIGQATVSAGRIANPVDTIIRENQVFHQNVVTGPPQSGPSDPTGTAASSPMDLIRALVLSILAAVFGRRRNLMAVVQGIKRKLYPWRRVEGL